MPSLIGSSIKLGIYLLLFINKLFIYVRDQRSRLFYIVQNEEETLNGWVGLYLRQLFAWLVETLDHHVLTRVHLLHNRFYFTPGQLRLL